MINTILGSTRYQLITQGDAKVFVAVFIALFVFTAIINIAIKLIKAYLVVFFKKETIIEKYARLQKSGKTEIYIDPEERVEIIKHGLVMYQSEETIHEDRYGRPTGFIGQVMGMNVYLKQN